MTRAAWMGLAAMLAVGCRSGCGGQRGAVADTGAPVDASVGRQAPPDMTNDPDPMAVVVSKGHVTVDDTELAALPASREEAARTGFERRYTRGGPEDMLVVPLFERAKVAHELNRQLHRPSVALIVAEPATPYRIVSELLYTLGHAEFTSFHMMVLLRANEPAAPPPPRPPLGRLVPRPEQRTGFLDLKVTIGHGGVHFATADGALGEGCKPDAPGVTVPVVGAGQDLAGVQRCAFQLKSTSMADTSVTLAADGDTDYGTVIDMVDALREVDGQKLFPDVIFGAPK